MKAWIHPALCISGSGFYWCDGVEIFLAHFGPFTNWALILTPQST